MTKFITALLVAIILSFTAFAHDGHGEISDKKAKSIAEITLRKMTFKDMGFEVGKLGKAWNAIKSEDASIYQKLEKEIIVRVRHPETAQVVYVIMSKEGRIKDVKGAPTP